MRIEAVRTTRITDASAYGSAKYFMLWAKSILLRLSVISTWQKPGLGSQIIIKSHTPLRSYFVS